MRNLQETVFIFYHAENVNFRVFKRLIIISFTNHPPGKLHMVDFWCFNDSFYNKSFFAKEFDAWQRTYPLPFKKLCYQYFTISLGTLLNIYIYGMDS